MSEDYITTLRRAAGGEPLDGFWRDFLRSVLICALVFGAMAGAMALYVRCTA